MKVNDLTIGDFLLKHSDLGSDAAFALSLIFFIPGAAQSVRSGFFWFPVESTARLAHFYPSTADARVAAAWHGFNELVDRDILRVCEKTHIVLVPELIRWFRPESAAELFGRVKRVAEQAVSAELKEDYLQLIRAEAKNWGPAYEAAVEDALTGDYVPRKKDGTAASGAGSEEGCEIVVVSPGQGDLFEHPMTTRPRTTRTKATKSAAMPPNVPQTADLFGGTEAGNPLAEAAKIQAKIDRGDANTADETSVRPSAELENYKEAKRYQYTEAFEAAWKAYPKRQGDNPKRRAFSAWSARLREGHSAAEIQAGVERYARYCDSRGLTGTELVKHAATFFGPDHAFLELWETQGARHQNRHIREAQALEEYRTWEREQITERVLAEQEATALASATENTDVTAVESAVASETPVLSGLSIIPEQPVQGLTASDWDSRQVAATTRKEQVRKQSLENYNEMMRRHQATT